MIGDRIRTARKKLKFTQTKFAKEIGISPNYLSELEANKKSPSERILKLMEIRFAINKDWLLTGEGEMFRKKEDSVEFVKMTAVPVLNAEAPAGFPALPPEQDEIIDYIYLPNAPKKAYAVKVKGNSMSPTIKDGDYVIFVPNAEIKNGDIVIARDEWNEVVLKRYRIKNGEVFLTSDNPEYPTIKPNSDYQIIGRVMKKVSVEDF